MQRAAICKTSWNRQRGGGGRKSHFPCAMPPYTPPYTPRYIAVTCSTLHYIQHSALHYIALLRIEHICATYLHAYLRAQEDVHNYVRHADTQTHSHADTHACIRAHAHPRTPAQTHTRTHAHTRARTRAHVHVQSCIRFSVTCIAIHYAACRCIMCHYMTLRC